jgi:NADH-quinone oxidoreductase subunit M
VIELNLVSILILLPILGTVFVFLSANSTLCKSTALWNSAITLILSFTLLTMFNFSKNTIQYIDEYNWLPNYGIKYKVGLDKFSLPFICMISLICFLTKLWILKKKIHKTKYFLAAILLFESFSIGAFCSYDLFLLLVFLESTTIPIIIMIFSSEKNYSKNAVMQFLMYGMLSTICITIAFVSIYNSCGTADLLQIYKHKHLLGPIPFWLLIVGIAVKIPIFPLYYWLPEVHVQSPTTCSVLLGSIALKFSSLILLRILFPVFYDQIMQYTKEISVLCVISMVLSCSNIFMQDDLKKIFAYFSILHMNMCMLIFLSGIGLRYFVFSLLSHSFVLAMLFFSTDAIHTVLQTRSIVDLKKNSPQLVLIKNIMFSNILILIGVPLTSGFMVDIVSVYASYKLSAIYATILVFIILALSTYLFFTYQSIFNQLKNKTDTKLEIPVGHLQINSISKKMVFVTISTCILFLGIFSSKVLM